MGDHFVAFPPNIIGAAAVSGSLFEKICAVKRFLKICAVKRFLSKRQIDGFELFQTSLFVLKYFVNEPCVFGNISELL